jgi:hypothetical protein
MTGILYQVLHTEAHILLDGDGEEIAGMSAMRRDDRWLDSFDELRQMSWQLGVFFTT